MSRKASLFQKAVMSWGYRGKEIFKPLNTGHTGWSDDLDFVFAHKDQVCDSMKKQKPHDPNAPYDGYDERDDTEEKARNVRLEKALPVSDKIRTAYRDSKDIYDTVLTRGNIWSRAYMKFFWSDTDDNEVAAKVLSYIPDDFDGTVLDVPVGTAVFTENKWKRLSSAKTTCLDYSMDMLEKAKHRLGECDHITLMQGDVAHLPISDESCDIVMSMNGFHAFPDKKKAFRETYRVLKKGGMFIACFYIKGECARTDRLVHRILAKKGWFTPPFPTREQLLTILNRLYASVDLHTDGSIVYFRCKK